MPFIHGYGMHLYQMMQRSDHERVPAAPRLTRVTSTSIIDRAANMS